MLLATLLFIGASYIGCTSASSISSTVNAIHAIPENGEQLIFSLNGLKKKKKVQNTNSLINRRSIGLHFLRIIQRRKCG